MARGNVLVISSNATHIEVHDGGTGRTGNYLNEKDRSGDGRD